MDEPVARFLVEELRRRGHEVREHGALRSGADPQWAVCSEAAARDVAEGARRWNDANVTAAGLLLAMTAVTSTMTSNRRVEAALRAAAPADDPDHPESRDPVQEGAI
ncbi:hypothetical protein [Streptomyces sp. NPDC001410]|uniref:hypothetical protein n=1 Tax=Streptomyces sp. NPDC001410 TaxID=3364574 RepID=UPI0036BCB283